MYPEIILKGTIIRIGKHPTINEHAIGVEYQMEGNMPIDENGQAMNSVKGTVIRNPNRWHSKQVYHRINLKYDKIIGGASASNKYNKNVLETL